MQRRLPALKALFVLTFLLLSNSVFSGVNAQEDGLLTVKVVDKNTVMIEENITVTVIVENFLSPINQSTTYRNDTFYNLTINEYLNLPEGISIWNDTVCWWNSTDSQRKSLDFANLTVPVLNVTEWVKLSYQININTTDSFTLPASNITYVFFTNTTSGDNETRYQLTNNGRGIFITIVEEPPEEEGFWRPGPGTKDLTEIFIVVVVFLPFLGVFFSYYLLKKWPKRVKK
ncbi:MAG: hypothetical protein ACFE68_05335 [Candidatus Hodarchaeota archaeon]